MKKIELVEALRTLSEGPSQRSETARLQDIESELDAAIRAGVSRKAILAALHSQGFTMSFKSFESALYRLRQRRKGGKLSRLSPVVLAHLTKHLTGTPVGEFVTPQGEPVISKLDGQMGPDGEDRPTVLDGKQRRELLADQFIQPDSTNPLLKRLKQKRKEQT